MVVSVCQIVILTKYWTKLNVAAVCVSVVMFFICSRITHSSFLFQRSPSDYYFLGNVLDQSNPVLFRFHTCVLCCFEATSGQRH